MSWSAHYFIPFLICRVYQAQENLSFEGRETVSLQSSSEGQTEVENVLVSSF